MKAQVKLKDAEKQFWLDMSERRAHSAYVAAGGKESWASYRGEKETVILVKGLAFQSTRTAAIKRAIQSFRVREQNA